MSGSNVVQPVRLGRLVESERVREFRGLFGVVAEQGAVVAVEDLAVLAGLCELLGERGFVVRNCQNVILVVQRGGWKMEFRVGGAPRYPCEWGLVVHRYVRTPLCDLWHCEGYVVLSLADPGVFEEAVVMLEGWLGQCGGSSVSKQGS